MKYRVLKSILSKWLFTATMVLVFSMFSGFVSPLAVKIAVPNTTLIVKSTGKLTKSVYYKCTSKPTAYNRWLNLFPANYFSKLSHAHTVKTQLVIKKISKPVVNNTTSLFYRQVIYPQNTTDGTNII